MFFDASSPSPTMHRAADEAFLFRAQKKESGATRPALADPR